eukprot:TRINITY_DN4282_c0_g2_i4.p1 TRINITY_DN4282_c0_g2~~TRINITY_DN4282_c0_g2_i4.p1  ORF type:complete len:164 (+),score=60.25 TRINITY_DN4282_c0_g2_i4:196-687(+)
MEPAEPLSPTSKTEEIPGVKRTLTGKPDEESLALLQDSDQLQIMLAGITWEVVDTPGELDQSAYPLNRAPTFVAERPLLLEEMRPEEIKAMEEEKEKAKENESKEVVEPEHVVLKDPPPVVETNQPEPEQPEAPPVKTPIPRRPESTQGFCGRNNRSCMLMCW